MKKLTILLCFCISFANAQTRRDTAVSALGDKIPLIKVFVGTVAQLRALNNATYTTAQTTDYGGGVWYVDASDVTTADNGVTCIVDTLGRRWKRQWDGKVMMMDWFLASTVTDTSDITTQVQSAVDMAPEVLRFTTVRKYRWVRAWVPMLKDIFIDGNGCRASPALKPIHAGGMWMVDPFRTSNSTGKYVGGTNNTIAPIIKYGKVIRIENFNVDLEWTTESFVSGSLAFSFNTIINRLQIQQNVITNFSRYAISIQSINLRGDTTSYYQKAIVDHNTIKYGSPFVGMVLMANAAIGDTAIDVATMDGEPIEGRLGVRRYFQIGTNIVGAGLDVTGFATTNGVFRLNGYVINPTDASRAILYFTRGSYHSTNGFIDSAKGLGAPVVKNAMLLGTYGFPQPLLQALPTVNGTAGNSYVVLANSTTTNLAYKTNAGPGLECTVNSPLIFGRFTITKVGNDTIYLDKPLPFAISSLPLIPFRTPGGCLSFGGDIKSGEVTNNYFYAASHGTGWQGTVKPKMFAENGDNRFKCDGNEYWYMWMDNEITNGGTARTTGLSTAWIEEGGCKAGENWDTLQSPSSYRLTTKDFGFGTVKVFTGSSTADASITYGNSFGQRDIWRMEGMHNPYLIVDLDSVSPTIKRVKWARWDNKLKDTIAGGFEATVQNWYTGVRTYCESVGQEGSIRYMQFSNNKSHWLMRNEGGGGYVWSGRVHEVDYFKNFSEQSEHGAFEIDASKLNMYENIFKFSMFNGTVPMPSLTKTNGAAGRGHLGYGTIFATDATIINNEFSGEQPVGNTNPYSGSFLLQPSLGVLETASSLNLSGNILNGVTRTLFTTGHLNAAGIPYIYYDRLTISDNIIDLSEGYVNDGFYRFFYGKTGIYKGNTITKKKGSAISSLVLFLTGQRPNYEFFDSSATRYDQHFDGNSYPGNNAPTLNIPFNKSKLFNNDLRDRVQGIAKGKYMRTSLTDSTQLEGVDSPSPSIANNFTTIGTGSSIDSTSLQYFDRVNKYIGLGGTTSPGYDVHYIGDSLLRSNMELRFQNPRKAGARSNYLTAYDGNNLGAFMGMLNGAARFGSSGNAIVYFAQNGTNRGAIGTNGFFGFQNTNPAYVGTFGTAGTTAGAVAIAGLTTGYLVFTAADGTTTYTVKMPAAIGSANQVLKISSVAGGVATTAWAADDNSGGGGGGSNTIPNGNF